MNKIRQLVEKHRNKITFLVLLFMWGYTHLDGYASIACLAGAILSAGYYVFARDSKYENT